jgi:phosphoglycolate phosphatase-like HAD superfamily hydrolase
VSGEPDRRVLCEVATVLRRAPPRLSCFDFGGTLFDFTPLHVTSFLSALGLDEGAEPIASDVAGVIQAAVAAGLDSFEMLRAVEQQIGLPRNARPEAIVVQKRAIVEERLRKESLHPLVCEFLMDARCYTMIAVLSLGLVSSMEAILKRSLNEKAKGIRIYGRRTLRDRVDKTEILRRVIEDHGVSAQEALYLADAEVDEASAAQVGIAFVRMRTFD